VRLVRSAKTSGTVSRADQTGFAPLDGVLLYWRRELMVTTPEGLPDLRDLPRAPNLRGGCLRVKGHLAFRSDAGIEVYTSPIVHIDWGPPVSLTTQNSRYVLHLIDAKDES
jgi:hypothetical protein